MTWSHSIHDFTNTDSPSSIPREIKSQPLRKEGEVLLVELGGLNTDISFHSIIF